MPQQNENRFRLQWFSDADTPEERRKIRKLDLLVVPFAMVSYWIKYVDQTNLNNAYVAGLKEDLGFYGNELVQLQTLFILGTVLGQLPFLFLMTYIPIQWLIPVIDIIWGIFTLLQYRVESYAELAAYRFFVGWFEAPFFPAMHYMLGSWYRGDEIARRTGLFYLGLSLGTLTAGLIQAGASANLDGVAGLEGWRWMYIICAIITIPIGVVGYFIIPGTPDKPNRMVLNDDDIRVLSDRLEKAGHENHGKFKLSQLKTMWKNKRIWALLGLDILFWNLATQVSSGAVLLWLRSLGRYSAARINELGVIPPSLGIFFTLLGSFGSDMFLGPAWTITTGIALNSIGLIILMIWLVPEAALWFAFAISYSAYGMSPVFHGWVNNQLRASPSERAFTLVMINVMGQSTTAWTPLLVFRTVEAPRFVKGFAFCFTCGILAIAITQGLEAYNRRHSKRSEAEIAPPEVVEGIESGDEKPPLQEKSKASLAAEAQK